MLFTDDKLSATKDHHREEQRDRKQLKPSFDLCVCRSLQYITLSPERAWCSEWISGHPLVDPRQITVSTRLTQSCRDHVGICQELFLQHWTFPLPYCRVSDVVLLYRFQENLIIGGGGGCFEVVLLEILGLNHKQGKVNSLC